jgi:pimeloyl-ACP methyl ester carboxylesterase
MCVPPFVKNALLSLLRIFLAVAMTLVFFLIFFQSKLIYHPRPYSFPPAEADPALVLLPYTTSQGRQQAYYLPPGEPPRRRLWVLFGGNGSLALDWVEFLRRRPDPHDGFLMIDYPGYGECRGAASPKAIEESAEAAFAHLAQSLNIEPAALDRNMGVMGLSLGCAAGLNFAVRHPVSQVILLAPFTSMHDMARRTVGWPLCLLLMHNYDNRARVRELAARPRPPRMDIFHGDEDRTIPIAMGRELAAIAPRMITFHDVHGAGHNTVVSKAKEEVRGIMGEE